MNCTRWMVQTLSLRDMDEWYEMDGTNLVSESHGLCTICVTQHCFRQYELYEIDGTKPCLQDIWMNCTRWMVQTLSLRAMDELHKMDGTNLVSESWMNCTRWMVQTLSLRAMDELHKMDGTNLVSESHG